jgi:adenosylcobinamide-GDP ribazoletransferase
LAAPERTGELEPLPPASSRPAILRSLWGAAGLFTAIPVRTPRAISRSEAARAVCWLPAIGVLVALPAAGVMLAAETGGHGAVRRLLAAALAVATLAVLTGALHLDGLADTADGLGSRRPSAEALAIMRRSDIGPFGVAALVLTLLVQVAALAAIQPRLVGAAALTVAAVTGRAGVLLATGPGSPPARADGFGALVAAATTTRTRLMQTVLLLAAVAAGAAALGGPKLAWRGVAAVLAGLLAAGLLRRAALRLLGGLTGDVFGAIIEVSTTTVLLVLALTA